MDSLESSPKHPDRTDPRVGRPRTTLTIEQKVELLQFLYNGGSVRQASEKFGVKGTTISSITKNKEQIYKYYMKNKGAVVMKDKDTYALDEPLVKWIRAMEEQGMKIIGNGDG